MKTSSSPAFSRFFVVSHTGKCRTRTGSRRRVVVDLRALALREDVLDVERVPAEGPASIPARGVGRVEVDPVSRRR
jgi:hypothetical protein